jgi:general secretion pathway protein G
VRGHQNGGFTLIEVLVVSALIVTLAGIVLVAYQNSVTRAKEAVLKENLFQMRKAIDEYRADKGRYPTALDELVTEGYLREIPKDPMTSSAATWRTEPAPHEPLDVSTGVGIGDVRSGSDGTALDGTRYADW